ncbi:alpha-ketoglutarate-dependent dioxygenase alkB homolog 7, mitochondrial [Melanaphis sacchari]|uniref:Putative alpha-ketoglutarate-dependent dioxygenase ABH7 n=2 Tax=Melanaphis sacchari TaxID=742174 RepID=A0A2H8TIH4_9HEMI|nr:alpha-ketoglutarate-dependent dioxygenase alkB homolog 7, mitochondrial [Melanaphis sacchari]
MFIFNLACKKFMLNQLFSVPRLFHLSKLLSTSFSSTEYILNSVDKNEYIKYKFPNEIKIKNLVDIKRQQFDSSFTIIPDIVSVDEESRLINEIEKSLKRLRYQHDHWDDAIHGYRETEIMSWKDQKNTNVIQRLRNKVFANESITEQMQRVHVLDLCDDGYVKPHIDSIRFCGNIIAGLSLLSDSVMRLADENYPDTYVVYALLPRRSLYIMKNSVRYQYTHEILSDGAPSVFNDKQIVRKRRVSIVMRNEPPVEAMK